MLFWRLLNPRSTLRLTNHKALIQHSYCTKTLDGRPLCPVENGRQTDEVPLDPKQAILKASLQHVNSLGWTIEALAAGAFDLGYSSASHGLFLNGGADLVHYFNQDSNEKLDKELDVAVEVLPQLQKIEFAIKKRLQMVVPHLDKWPLGISLILTPQQAPIALKNTRNLADVICHHAGYKDTDMKWYSRRLGIMSVYKLTELRLIQDKSADQEQTWRFLRTNVERLGSFYKCEENIIDFNEVAFGGLVTFKNMLGFNR